jgi:hypothetical protein
MRKLTATLLAAGAVTGIVGTGAALAAGPHPAKPATVAMDRTSRDKAGDKASRDRAHIEHTSPADRSTGEASSQPQFRTMTSALRAPTLPCRSA